MNSHGCATAFAIDDQPPRGLKTKPLQMTNAARFEGFDAANSTARGAENDSASNTNDSNSGIADFISESNSEYGRSLSDGYVTAVTVIVLGSAATKAANN